MGRYLMGGKWLLPLDEGVGLNAYLPGNELLELFED